MPHLVLTELRPTGSLFAGKEILRDNCIKHAPEILHYRHRRIEFDHIAEFYEYVSSMQYDNAFIIRGLIDTNSKVIFRRKYQRRNESVFRDHSAALLPFDIDDIACPAAEWMADPRGAVDRRVIQRLGLPFSRTSYVAQLTGTHGLIKDQQGKWTGEIGGDVLSVRIFFISMRGLLETEATGWLELLHDAVLPEIDPACGRLIQPNYIARPKWNGHARDEDPLGEIEPCWMVERDFDRLPVPDLTEVVQRQKRIKAKRRAENAVHSAAIVAQHPNVLAAVRSIGLPIDGKTGLLLDNEAAQGDIYAHLLAASAHMLASEKRSKGESKEDFAERLRDGIAALCEENKTIIHGNLQKHQRTGDHHLLKQYLTDDVARLIIWLIEHGNKTRRKIIKRTKQGQQFDLDPGDDLADAETLCAILFDDDLPDAMEDWFDWKDAVREVRKEARKETEEANEKLHRRTA